MTKFKYCYNKCMKKFFGYTKYYSVTEMLLTLRLPSFDTVIHNYKKSFLCVWSKHSNDLVKLLRCVCPSAFLWVLLCFIVHHVLLFFLLLLLFCLTVCVCLLFMLMGRVAWIKWNDDDRERHHNKTLILKTADMNERDFLISNLHKIIYCHCNPLTA